jgi:thiol-disulfide isomerase/thioredoxin
VDFSADLSQQGVPEVKGSAATTSLYKFVENIKVSDKSIMSANDSILKFKSTERDSMTGIYLQQRDNEISNYYSAVKAYADTVKNIPNAMIAIEALLFDEEFEYIKSFAQRVANSSDSSSAYVKELLAKLRLYESMQAQSYIGKPAPEIVQQNPEGATLKLSDLKGSVVLVDFWASWCAPCRKENPNVVKVYNAYKNKGFTIYSVSLDTDKQKWVSAIEKDGLLWSTHVSALTTRNNQAALDYKITAIPMSYLINKEGIIVAENLRGENLETTVRELVQNN